jgi:hypothetical protein
MRIVCMVSPRRLAPTMVGLTLTMCVLVHGEHSGLCVTLTIESAPSSGHAGGCMPRHATRRHARDDFKGWRHQHRYQYPSSARAAKRRLWWWGRPPSSRSRPRPPRPPARRLRRLRTLPCPRAASPDECRREEESQLELEEGSAPEKKERKTRRQPKSTSSGA